MNPKRSCVKVLVYDVCDTGVSRDTWMCMTRTGRVGVELNEAESS